MAGAQVPRTVPAKLRLPDGDGPFPAVLVMHGSGGIDGRGAAMAEALLAAGFASLEPDMWRARGLTGGANSRARTVVDTLPDTWGAWRYLASNPKIDRTRIAILGFSWGGTLAWATAFGLKPANAPADVEAAKFAAHVPFYGVCTNFLPGGRGDSAMKGYGATKPTGAPMLYVVGTADDYEANAESCGQLLKAHPDLPATLRLVEGASHGFDGNLSTSFYDSLARNGRGNNIRMIPNASEASKVRGEVVDFLKKALFK